MILDGRSTGVNHDREWVGLSAHFNELVTLGDEAVGTIIVKMA
jgi:hypothetical protein